MQIDNTRQQLLDMQEHPELYSDEQIEAMMDALDQVLDVQREWREFVERTGAKSHATKNFQIPYKRLKKVAAIFLAAAFLGGMAWAICGPFLTSPKEEESQPAQVTAPSLTGRAGGESSSVLFSDVRLDSLLTVVSAHYGKALCFRDTAVRALRLNTVWDSADSLVAFVETLNEFDDLRLRDERDTLFVESATEDEE